MASSKGFDFATDDILCSYEDLNNQPSNGVHSDESTVPTPAKESLNNRTSRSMSSPAYCPTEESLSQEVASAVEHTMKKHTDNVMRFLEGISSRLSQLELYCYNVDKSVGEMRCDLERDHTDADLKLLSIDKNIQEVRRSVKILKDKQELADTHKDLAKLHFVQKETSSASNSQLNSERSASSTPDPPQKVETAPDMQGMQLALVEHQQTLPPQSQSVTQSPAYYVPAQLHYVQSDSHYQVQQMQDMSRVSHLPPQPQTNQSQQHSLPQYQQQWVQQMPHQHQQQQQQQQQMAPMQTQVRPQLTAVYSQYPSSQPANPTPESPPNSMPIQMTYPKVSQPGQTEATSYVYMGPNGTMHPSQQQQQQQQLPPQQPQYAYMVYEGESARPRNTLQLPPQQSQYPPTSVSLQAPQANVGTNIMVRPPTQFLRGHPHGEVIEKLVSMGYRADHVASVIQRLEESGQPVDFNAVIDRLNGHSSRSSQGGWSG